MKVNFMFSENKVFGFLVFGSTVVFAKKHTVTQVVLVGKVRDPFHILLLK